MNTTKNYSRLLATLLFTFFLLSSAHSQTAYVTKTGKKYHIETCRYLKYSKISVSLTEAKDKGYAACSVCKPDIHLKTQIKTQAKSDSTKIVPAARPPIQKAVASQCTATTQAGSRCKRRTKNSSGKCWQHE